MIRTPSRVPSSVSPITPSDALHDGTITNDVLRPIVEDGHNWSRKLQ
jgi:hypothetical protein